MTLTLKQTLDEREVKLILADGGDFKRAFYATVNSTFHKAETEGEQAAAMKGIPAITTKDGTVYTNGISTYAKIILRMLMNQKPTHFAIVWDTPRGDCFRREIYPEYKGNRSETPKVLLAQEKWVKNLLTAMGVPQLYADGFEADDVIGTIAHRFRGSGLPTYIVTKDKDCMQLIGGNTKVWYITKKVEELCKQYKLNPKKWPRSCFEWNEDVFVKHYGIKPQQVIDLKALAGDTGDNIPGIKGVGDKTAMGLLKIFNSVEDIYGKIESMNSAEEKKLKEELKKHGVNRSPFGYLRKGKEDAFLSKKLATIKTDIESFKDFDASNLELMVDYQRTIKALNYLQCQDLAQHIA